MPLSQYPTSPTVSDQGEEALDVEWAHAMAPGANILLVEAPDYVNTVPQKSIQNTLLDAIHAAEQYPISVFTMSYSYQQSLQSTSAIEQYLESNHAFLTPSGHQGITFLAATGDHG